MAMNPRLLVPRASYDPDAARYLAAVEAADGQALETPVKRAVDAFFRDLKSAGVFDDIKASCILCGARTLSGALVPLAGTAPTNNNFVAADYTRGGATPGLKGNGSTKYLDSNRANDDDPQNDNHNAVYVTIAEVSPNFGVYIGSALDDGCNNLGRASDPATDFLVRSRIFEAKFLENKAGATGFCGISRSAASSFSARVDGADSTVTATSQAPSADNVHVFQRSAGAGVTTARLAFYSIGEALDLEALDDAVSALVAAIGAAV